MIASFGIMTTPAKPHETQSTAHHKTPSKHGENPFCQWNGMPVSDDDVFELRYFHAACHSADRGLGAQDGGKHRAPQRARPGIGVEPESSLVMHFRSSGGVFAQRIWTPPSSHRASRHLGHRPTRWQKTVCSQSRSRWHYLSRVAGKCQKRDKLASSPQPQNHPAVSDIGGSGRALRFRRDISLRFPWSAPG